VSFVEDSCPHRFFLPTILRWTLSVGGGVVNLTAGTVRGAGRAISRRAAKCGDVVTDANGRQKLVAANM
jgi:hypothetical protein